MLNRIAKPFTVLVERYLPDPFILVLLLSAITIASASFFTGTPFVSVVEIWGNGLWNLLSFAMQMLLILLCGYMLANTPICINALEKLAKLPKSSGQAIIWVTLVAMCASWINWGFGLVIGALYAKAVARHVVTDYRVLIASSYSGFIVWHGGLSGSVPLTIATEKHFSADLIGVLSTSQTLFSSFNVAILITLMIVLPLLNRALLPPPAEQIHFTQRSPSDNQTHLESLNNATPSERLEHTPWLGYGIGGLGLFYLGYFFIARSGTLNLNTVIALFLFLAIFFHKTAHSLLKSLNEAIQGGAGIIIQFPFYAGIMAVMIQTGLAASVAQWFIDISNAQTLPVWSFLSAGLINVFVPSGGGQWAVQAPIVLPAALNLEADISRVAMAVAWGDAWTNLIQPFWALPVLAIAGLRAKDIMGYCLVQLLVTGLIITGFLAFWPN
ncbi:Short chain fatty acids transporter [Pseudoalteromonas luteoviolacea B = ATCC 29581]|nr:Short chain fatty acids transporter [Pseudoalteromonas luteoviolacea B = ATCC 29581]